MPGCWPQATLMATPTCGTWADRVASDRPRIHAGCADFTGHGTACGKPFSKMRLTVCRDAGKGVAERQCVDLLRALVGEHGLQVVGVPDDRVFQRDPIRPENRPGLPGDLDSGPHIGHLREADLFRGERAG